MTFLKTLDEYATEALLAELELRRVRRARGECDYCGRSLFSFPMCRFVERHDRSEFTVCAEFPDYEVSWRGLVRRINGGLMTHSSDSNGYPSVKLMLGGRRKRIAVHRLVAAAFLPPRPYGARLIRHLDGDKDHPAAWNLAWGDDATNAEDRVRHGRTRTITPEQQAKMIAARMARKSLISK